MALYDIAFHSPSSNRLSIRKDSQSVPTIRAFWKLMNGTESTIELDSTQMISDDAFFVTLYTKDVDKPFAFFLSYTYYYWLVVYFNKEGILTIDKIDDQKGHFITISDTPAIPTKTTAHLTPPNS